MSAAAPRQRPRPRDIALQAALLAVLLGAFAWCLGNAADALGRRGIAMGFSYLWEQAGFGIGESAIPFQPSDTYARAFLVGLLNTLKVSAFAIVAATILGVALGLMRLSPNLGARALSGAYVELFRNTPQLLQIIFWYWLITRLPGPRQALRPMEGLLISNRGVMLAWPQPHPAWEMAGWALLAGFVLAIGWAVLARLRRWPVLWPAIALILVLPLAAWAIGGAPTALEWPAVRGLAIRGGISVSPEFVALFLGLSLYIAAFVAEIVRGGVLSVPKAQVETARALGLKRGQISRLVVMPQALRVMVPPLAAQYVSLVKNSSLAVAIGYPDVVNISNTTLAQTGHVVEAVLLMSAVYLFISLVIGAAMARYNRAVLLQER
ncbi:MAG: transporter permease [Rubritepida sp.]|nr:transporter permease [Rubritepida sp.]